MPCKSKIGYFCGGGGLAVGTPIATGGVSLWWAIHYFRGAIHLGVAFFHKYIPEKAFDLGYKYVCTYVHTCISACNAVHGHAQEVLLHTL